MTLTEALACGKAFYCKRTGRVFEPTKHVARDTPVGPAIGPHFISADDLLAAQFELITPGYRAKRRRFEQLARELGVVA